MTARHHDPSVSRRGHNATYEIDKAYREGDLRTIVTIHCAKCKRSEELVWNTGHNPDFIKRRAISMGWLFDPFQRSACVCPNCHKRGGNHAVAQTKIPTPNVVELKQQPDQMMPRALLPDEKTKVRHALDSHFDDSTGRYIEGYSDKKIGEELEVPWLAVQHFREFAYGPIREDERVVALRTELVVLKADLQGLIGRVTALEEGIAKLL
jgi:hypothetical protein